MTTFVYLVYALGQLFLFGWSLRLFLRHRHPSTVPVLIVTFGLIYDNLMLFAGAMIGHGDLLEQLSVPRFFMHAFGTPLLIPTAFGLLARTGVKAVQHPWAVVAIALLTIAMMGVGAHADLLSLQLEAKQPSGVVSYGNAATSGPPVAPIVTILVLIAAGVIVGRRKGGPWLLLGAAAQFVAAAVGDALVIAGNLGELALLAGLVVTDHRLSRETSDAPRPQQGTA